MGLLLVPSRTPIRARTSSLDLPPVPPESCVRPAQSVRRNEARWCCYSSSKMATPTMLLPLLRLPRLVCRRMAYLDSQELDSLQGVLATLEQALHSSSLPLSRLRRVMLVSAATQGTHQHWLLPMVAATPESQQDRHCRASIRRPLLLREVDHPRHISSRRGAAAALLLLLLPILPLQTLPIPSQQTVERHKVRQRLRQSIRIQMQQT